MSARNQLPSEFEAIAILVEQIKHPALSVAALSRRLKARQLCVEPHRIQNLFVHHGLAVKKTSHLL